MTRFHGRGGAGTRGAASGGAVLPPRPATAAVDAGTPRTRGGRPARR